PLGIACPERAVLRHVAAAGGGTRSGGAGEIGSGENRVENQRPLFFERPFVFLSQKPTASRLVSCHRLANFLDLRLRGAVSICRSDRRSNRAYRNESRFIRGRRFLFQNY